MKFLVMGVGGALLFVANAHSTLFSPHHAKYLYTQSLKTKKNNFSAQTRGLTNTAAPMHVNSEQITETQSLKKRRVNYTTIAHTIDLIALGYLLYALRNYHTHLYEPIVVPPIKSWFFDFTPYVKDLTKPIQFSLFFAQESVRVIIYKTIAKSIVWYCTRSVRESLNELIYEKE